MRPMPARHLIVGSTLLAAVVSLAAEASAQITTVAIPGRSKVLWDYEEPFPERFVVKVDGTVVGEYEGLAPDNSQRPMTPGMRVFATTLPPGLGSGVYTLWVEACSAELCTPSEPIYFMVLPGGFYRLFPTKR